MQYQEFLTGVKQRGSIATHNEAERVIEASIETLGERLNSTSVDKLQSQLPKQLKRFLSEKKNFSHFSLEEYYNRVGARAGIRYSEAVRCSRAVMFMLNKTITVGLQREILSDLPPEFVELFGQEPTTPLSPTVTE